MCHDAVAHKRSAVLERPMSDPGGGQATKLRCAAALEGITKVSSGIKMDSGYALLIPCPIIGTLQHNTVDRKRFVCSAFFKLEIEFNNVLLYFFL